MAKQIVSEVLENSAGKGGCFHGDKLMCQRQRKGSIQACHGWGVGCCGERASASAGRICQANPECDNLEGAFVARLNGVDVNIVNMKADKLKFVWAGSGRHLPYKPVLCLLQTSHEMANTISHISCTRQRNMARSRGNPISKMPKHMHPSS